MYYWTASLFGLGIISYFIYKYYKMTTRGSNDFDFPQPSPRVEKGHKIIVTFKGDRYDITDFVNKHPGGKHVLIENNGRDIEELMLENEHSPAAYAKLAQYKIKE